MKKGAFAVLMCYVLWGILPIFWKLLNQLDPVYILASRIFWSLIFCFVLIIFKKESLKIKEVIKNKKEILLLCAAGLWLVLIGEAIYGQ
ncbi:Putative membrane protein [Clostridium neonatale]|nr:Putative membrane protein [Clostridium neonatale]